MEREWTVAELIAELARAPADAKVRIMDADTYWTIPKFTVQFDLKDGCYWFYPCEYSEMIS